MRNARRPQRQFPSANQCSIDGQWKENIRISLCRKSVLVAGSALCKPRRGAAGLINFKYHPSNRSCIIEKSTPHGNAMFALSSWALVKLALLLFAASGIFLTSKRLLWNAAPDVEVVLSAYREDPTLVSQQITLLRHVLAMHGWSSRVVVYSKHESLLLDRMEPILKVLGADAIVSLPNRGREGGT